MPISQAGALNTAALTVPGAYISIVPPAPTFLNGVPSNIEGIVGTASWGPENSPTFVGNPQQYQAIFGQLQNRLFDMGTALNLSVQQGASNFACVRVTDGTDTAASATVLTNCLTLTSKYTGTFGNGIQVAIAQGSQAGSFQVSVFAPGLVPETFQNVGAGLTGNALWIAIANAINAGANVLRGPSNIIVASAGAGTTAPATATYAMSGGADGANISASNLIGSDSSSPRTGMYALRNSQASVAVLADCDTSSTWAAQVAYGLSEGTYMILTSPFGDTIANAIATKTSAGIDSYAAKLMLGDWPFWLDPINGVRAVSPQGFVAGLLANSSPQLGALNAQIQGIVGTQKSQASQVYANADLQLLAQAGIDCIANPSPGGSYFSCFLGHNTSSNPLINGDSYTRLTNYIAYTLNAGMGKFVGQVNNPDVQASALATLSSFFDTLWEQGLIGNPNSRTQVPYSVDISANNNPISREALGYLQADVQVELYPIIEKLLVNLTAGASVQVTRQGVSLAA